MQFITFQASKSCVSFFIIFCTTYLMHNTRAANILVLPMPMWSHIHVGGIVGRSLAADGHDVWILAPEDKKVSLEKQGLHVLSSPFSYLPEFENRLKDALMYKLFDSKAPGGYRMTSAVTDYKEANYRISMEILQNAAIMNQIAAVQFDLAVVGCIFMFRSFYLIPYKYNIPYITYSMADTPSLVGVPGLPSFQPFFISSPPLTDQMTFSERLRNTFMSVMYNVYTEYLDWGLDIPSSFAPEKPIRRPSQLMSESLMWLVTANDLCLDFPRMSAPHYRFIGTLTPERAGELTGDLKKYADGATSGLILVTYDTSGVGSIVMDRYLPLFLEAAGQLEQRFIIVHHSKNLPKQFPENVRLESWIPQNDLLGHPSTVLMVQHGGVNSQVEATYHGVPQVCLGYQEEKRYNCHRLEHHHYGVALELHDLTTERLIEAIRDVITDSSYRSNVTRCARIMRSMPQPRDALRFWVNHVLEFGGAHLRPSSLDMPLYSLYMLDIMALVAAIVGFTLLVGIICAHCFCKTFCNRDKQKQKSE